ncbi:transposable element Tcb1 transposase [Trichonephila clavipes]|uniref:Transposable element Tcb1 transposase n=1 Tax=Trichonephila clavipes TaxID=2585209 RepID=A0A8X6SQY7_TRICX|nr:transposable element Tcb1 transposase [Trichonephila clavipes]
MWAAEWNEVVFTDESRICLQHYDGRIRVCRHRGERMLNNCVIHRHTGHAPGIMVWGGIGYPTRTPLERNADTVPTASNSLPISAASSLSTACSGLETTTTTSNTIPATSQDANQSSNPVEKNVPLKTNPTL